MTIEFGDKVELKSRFRAMKSGFYDYDIECGHVKINRETGECIMYQGKFNSRNGVIIRGMPREFKGLCEKGKRIANSILNWREVSLMAEIAPHVPVR